MAVKVSDRIGAEVGGQIRSATLREMNRAATFLVLSLAACGSGMSEPLFGGFTPANGAAVILAAKTCSNIPSLGPTAISGILVELTSGADACNVLTQARQCGTGASSSTLLIGALSGVVGGSTVGPADPGSYPWLANPPTGLRPSHPAAQVDATCTSAAGSPTRMVGGSVTITTVTASASPARWTCILTTGRST